MSPTDAQRFDVREMPPPERHSAIHERFDALSVGEAFVLVNDHDPKPLYYEMRSTRGATFEWTYLRRGPREWAVEIRKTSADGPRPIQLRPTSDADASSDTDDDAATGFDLRQIPEAERQHTVLHRFGLLADGEQMDLLHGPDDDPRSLFDALKQSHGERFTWEYLERGPDRWRVRLTRGFATVSDRPNSVQASSSPRTTEALEELDVRPYEPAERHRLIFERYDALAPGEAFELINDHDPKPLYYQFEAEAGPEFRWAYREQGPDEWRVLIGKWHLGA
ncbi:MAG: DUF2249 domain-containing protein [Candidatus Bipolaricaulia bacterium]